MNAHEIFELSPIVPVVTITDANDALPLAKALLDGGINIMEITLRTSAGLDAIKVIAKELPQMHVGAGTVLNRADFQRAVDNGAQFVFSPGISQELINTAKELQTPFIPGVATASEVMLAKNSGLHHCKLFPASVVGGVSALKAFTGPYPDMKFCPTGGVNLENLNDFLACENVMCIGGSWIVPKTALKEKDFQLITQLCQEALSS